MRARLFFGGIINLAVAAIFIPLLARFFMDRAEAWTGAEYGWPQIGFMSAYPDHIRNGYLMFVLAVMLWVSLASGLAPVGLGASPGKAICGLHYVDAKGRRATAAQHLLRMIMIAGLVAFVLLAGPILGFVFGASADPYSLGALALGLILMGLAVFRLPGKDLSWVNHRAGLRPALRTPDKDTL